MQTWSEVAAVVLLGKCYQLFVVLLHPLEVVSHANDSLFDVVARFHVAVLELKFCRVTVFLERIIEFAKVLVIDLRFAQVDLLLVCERFFHPTSFVASLCHFGQHSSLHVFKWF